MTDETTKEEEVDEEAGADVDEGEDDEVAE